MATGGPNRRTEKIINAICQRLAEGESLNGICSDPEMPSTSTVYRWLGDPSDDTFKARYRQAREHQADFYADQIVEIADTEDNPQKARIRIDARKWKAAKMRPHVYGDKVMQQHSGDLVLTIETGVPRAND